MQPCDVAFLPGLWVASWREAMPGIDFDARRGWLEAFLCEPVHRTLMAEVRGRILGFVTTEGDHLHQLVVTPGAKGNGTATRLLAAAKDQSSGALALDVNQANTRAVRFYSREGFAIEAGGVNPSSGLPTWRMVWRRG